MTPIVQIWLNGQDISGRLSGRVLEARIEETEGEKTQDYVFPHIFGTETEAKNAASAHSAHFKRNEAHFHGALRPGIIAPAAGGIITTAGFGDDDDRSWTIKHKTAAFHDGIEITH